MTIPRIISEEHMKGYKINVKSTYRGVLKRLLSWPFQIAFDNMSLTTSSYDRKQPSFNTPELECIRFTFEDTRALFHHNILWL